MKSEVSYQNIKSDVLGAYYGFCITRGYGLGMPHEQLVGSVDYEFEKTYKTAIENLMLKVVVLALSAGMHPDVEMNLRKEIKHQLFEINLEGIIRDDISEFKEDLHALHLL